jgi:hypothetical protein
MQIMKAKVKSLMQKTHPDKASGYVEEFKSHAPNKQYLAELG